jgi:hypothetical protein
VIACWRDAGLTASPVEVPEPLVEHLLLAVAAGGGISVLRAAAAARHSLPGVRFVPLSPAPATEVAAVTRDESSTSVAALLTLVRRVEHLASQADARALTVHGSRMAETSNA